MDKEQIKAFESRLEMCSSEGWKDFIEEIAEFEKIIDSVNGVSGLEELYMRKGKLELIRWIKSLKEVTSDNYDRLNEEEKNADL